MMVNWKVAVPLRALVTFCLYSKNGDCRGEPVCKIKLSYKQASNLYHTDILPHAFCHDKADNYSACIYPQLREFHDDAAQVSIKIN